MSVRVPSFAPSGNAVTVSLSVTINSARLQFDGFNPASVTNQSPATVTPAGKSRAVRLYNAGPSTVFFEFVGAQGMQTATPQTGVPLASGQTEKFTPNGGTWLAAVTASGTATIYATPGEGL